MITETTMLYLYVETPLHAGVGSGLSSIDLPIQRERTTQYPMIQGSGIKGKLRAAMEGDRKNLSPEERNIVDILFGPPPKPAEGDDNKASGNDHAGALIAGDARILLFPVRSLNGVFAYTTSYDVLNRFMRDMNRGGGTVTWQLPQERQSAHTAHVTQEQISRVAVNNMVVLEEFSFTAEENSVVDDVAIWIAENALPKPDEAASTQPDNQTSPQPDDYKYWRDKIKDSLVILPEDDFRDFVLYATEVITRVRIDRDKKTVERGALWTEEHLPTDTLLYVPIYATDSRKGDSSSNGKVKMQAADILIKAKSLETSQKGYMQLGGDETVGRGMVRMHWGSK